MRCRVAAPSDHPDASADGAAALVEEGLSEVPRSGAERSPRRRPEPCRRPCAPTREGLTAAPQARSESVDTSRGIPDASRAGVNRFDSCRYAWGHNKAMKDTHDRRRRR